MPMNYGFLNEEEIVHRIDGKRIEELSHNLKNLLRDLYGVLDDEEIVHCQRTDDYIKPDIVIDYKNEKRYVSLKCGRSNIVHSEYVKNFVLFLRELGISKRTQQTILLYQYGDGTMLLLPHFKETYLFSFL